MDARQCRALDGLEAVKPIYCRQAMHFESGGSSCIWSPHACLIGRAIYISDLFYSGLDDVVCQVCITFCTSCAALRRRQKELLGMRTKCLLYMNCAVHFGSDCHHLLSHRGYRLKRQLLCIVIDNEHERQRTRKQRRQAHIKSANRVSCQARASQKA